MKIPIFISWPDVVEVGSGDIRTLQKFNKKDNFDFYYLRQDGDQSLGVFRLALFHERDVLVDLRLLVLQDALRDPDNVSNLLLLQLEKGIEDGIVELLLVGAEVESDLILKEGVLKRLLLAELSVVEKVSVNLSGG